MKYYDVDGILYRSDGACENYAPGANAWELASCAKMNMHGVPLSEAEARDIWPEAFKL